LRTELRNEIASAIPVEHCFAYACRWTGQPNASISTDHLIAFCADIERSLQEMIDRELQAVTCDALDREIGHHTAFAEEKIGSLT
jgi:hypothetical protein